MTLTRQCSRSACSKPAVATLTYVYADSTVVLGPLATYAEPHTYDLCADHAQRLTAPRGWDIVRLAVDMTPPEPTPDDLVALAEAVRRAAARPPAEPEPVPVRKPARAARAEDPAFLSTASRRRHLRALPDATDDDASTEAGADGR
ncbi:DUF3499 domain-containing protein [Dermacoccus abyssi]|uniref:DUF3499 domain-containing protein n=1 Tax=Dermacoccus abyssi TaxID=322596 RepID=UPI002AD34066|nr:DUF3499 domain-containing protein [Dermacoccus abyssi]